MAYGIDIKFEDDALMKIAEIAAAEKTGARGLVSAIEKTLIPFEKTLPRSGLKRFLVTPEVVDNPEAQLDMLLKNPEDLDRRERFERAREKEIAEIKGYISKTAVDFSIKSGLEIYDRRTDLIARLYLKNISDINTALDDFAEMYNQIKLQESSLVEKLEVEVSFDESAIDEIINQAIKTDQEAGRLALQLAKRLEYGLKLVKDRSGIEKFVINDEAVIDMDNFVNNLVKKFYNQEYPSEEYVLE
jgi:ATP-dependent protease Clp ATPase subunit